MLIIAIANPKGGTAKTTTAAHVAHALHAAGQTVLAVDADAENESLLRWSDLVDEWQIPVVALPSANMHRSLPGLARDKFDAVVIDTPPMDTAGGVVTSALRIATHVIVPSAPTTMDVDRIPAVIDMIDQVAPLRDEPPVVGVLLTQVVSSAAAGQVFTDLIGDMGVPVHRVRIPRLERYAQAFGRPVEPTVYIDVVRELLLFNPLPGEEAR